MCLKVDFFIVISMVLGMVLGMVFSEDEKLSYDDYKKHVLGQKSHLLIDVRSEEEAKRIPLKCATNIPHTQILNDENGVKTFDDTVKKLMPKKVADVYIICSRGFMAQKVYNLLKQKYSDCDEAVRLHRITDGVGM